jgi:hypothetical protein
MGSTGVGAGHPLVDPEYESPSPIRTPTSTSAGARAAAIRLRVVMSPALSRKIVATREGRRCSQTVGRSVESPSPSP